MSPTTGTSGPNAAVVPTTSSQATIRGIVSSSSPNSSSRRGDQRTASRSGSRLRLAVVTSVTSSP
ncbi:MAG: hypothetical protein U0S36_12155 [Candidatus Nanopelagicales bacterium]